MKVCSVCKVKAEWKEGTSKNGDPYAFWGCPKKIDGEFCRAKIIDVDDTAPLPEGLVREPVAEPIKQGDGMLACNATNNAVELAKAGVINYEQLEASINKIYGILEKIVYKR